MLLSIGIDVEKLKSELDVEENEELPLVLGKLEIIGAEVVNDSLLLGLKVEEYVEKVADSLGEVDRRLLLIEGSSVDATDDEIKEPELVGIDREDKVVLIERYTEDSEDGTIDEKVEVTTELEAVWSTLS